MKKILVGITIGILVLSGILVEAGDFEESKTHILDQNIKTKIQFRSILNKIIENLIARLPGLSTLFPHLSEFFSMSSPGPTTTDLIAGQHTDVGEVFVDNDGVNLYVTYTTTGGWGITETHLHVADTLGDIPQKKGNPIPGKFEYKEEHDMVTTYTYTIPLDWAVGTELYIAAHAEVCTFSDIEDLEDILPDQATVSAVHANIIGYTESYFLTTITNGGILNGVYNGWCIDRSANMHDYVEFIANVYSSYEPLPGGVVLYPENLDLLNYILNQNYVGKPSTCGGDYTYGDVQMAMWDLITTNNAPYPEAALGPYLPCRIDEIKAAAMANGEGYIPECGDVIAIILDPVGSEGQGSIIEYPMPCPDCETAWGDGEDFDGKNWAMYFTHTIY